MEKQTTLDLLRDSATSFPDEVALVYLPTGSIEDVPRVWTYRDYVDAVERAARMFLSLGANKNNAVSLLLPNIPEMQFAFFGAEFASVANPINPLLGPEKVAAIMEAAGTKVLVTTSPFLDADLWHLAKRSEEMLGRRIHIVAVGNGCPAGARSYWDTSVDMSPAIYTSTDRRAPAAYFHTGGTTGTPKLAIHSHENQISNAYQISTALDLKQSDVVLTGLPLFHVNAAILSTLSPLASGATLLLAGQNGFRSKTLIPEFWDIVEQYRVSIFSGVPTIYLALLEQVKSKLHLPALRYGVCGAAPMPQSLIEDFELKTGIKILEGYGLTESTCVCTLNPAGETSPSGSVGRPVVDQQIKISIVSERGRIVRDCDDDEVGTVLLKGPNVIEGYKDPVATAKLFTQDGWLNTGDSGRIDDGGFLFLTGREKDLIIRSGHNIDPAIVENSLASHPAVELVAAVGKPDVYAGELPVAFVQLDNSFPVSEEELISYARKNVSEAGAAPSEVFFLDEIPKTAVGKIFKPALRHLVRQKTYGGILNKIDGLEDCIVRSLDHPKYGSILEIEVPSSSRLSSGDIDGAIAAALNRFSIKWQRFRPHARANNPLSEKS